MKPFNQRRRKLSAVVLCLLAIAWVAGACAGEAEKAAPAGRRPFVVIGIDGAEWQVIEALWGAGELPAFRALAERGVRAQLATSYNSSPVIWTTIATGMRPEDHGIVDFVVPTPAGDVPASSTLRRVPALWSMASRAHRKVAVLGWWASWPAEQVDGLVVSDRATRELPDRVWPPEALPRVLEAAAEAARAGGGFDSNPEASAQDRLMAHLGRQVVTEGYDLCLVYFRGVDIASHFYWKHWQPEAFPGQRLDPAELAELAGRIPGEYVAVDRAIAAMLAAATPEPNVMVVSDHGFRAAKKEIVRVFLDFDRLLERLGFLVRAEDGTVDVQKSRLYTYLSPDFRKAKLLRFGEELAPRRRAAAREELEKELARIRWAGGEPVFSLREARGGREKDADFVAVMSSDGATETLLYDGDAKALAGIVTSITRISGNHTAHTAGIFLAAGPDVDPNANLAGIRIHDVAPTILYGLGLPVAKNFAGRAWQELYNEEFRRRTPLRTITAWDVPKTTGTATPSAADEEMVRELKSLGYL